jgi:hypothetical protein
MRRHPRPRAPDDYKLGEDGDPRGGALPLSEEERDRVITFRYSIALTTTLSGRHYFFP